MTASNGATATHDSTGTTAEQHYLTTPAKQLAITNRHATQVLYVKVYTSAESGTAANALAAAATDIVAAADDTIVIPAGVRKVVWKSGGPRYVAVDMIGSGATTTFSMEGTMWYD